MVTEYLETTNPSANERVAAMKLWAPWCISCVSFEQIYNKVATMVSDVDFYTVNVDKDHVLAQLNNVKTIPSVIFFYKEREVGRITGMVVEHDVLTVINNVKKQEGIMF